MYIMFCVLLSIEHDLMIFLRFLISSCPVQKFVVYNISVVFAFYPTGKKVSEKLPPKKENLKSLTNLENRKFIPNQKFIDQINRAQSSW